MEQAVPRHERRSLSRRARTRQFSAVFDSPMTNQFTFDPTRLTAALVQARSDLLAERTADGHWVGELSTSALSTATAVSALAVAGREASGRREPDHALDPSDSRMMAGGLSWLLAHQNADGGWGDTDKSYSNIATTMLVQAAIHLADQTAPCSSALERAESYLKRQGGIAGLRQRYGKDKTFAVPILTNCALAGLVDWTQVSPLPFELACIPQRFYRWTRMPVVSYAVPALVAIGQVHFTHRPPRPFPLRWLRQAAIEPSLRVLARMQPSSGGFLEAVPLTSFVVMSLAAAGRLDHHVTRRGLQFIRDSVRPDGSWPIDTNLATWTTSLAIHALACSGDDVAAEAHLPWLLGCQHRERHPFTGAAPGGWGWTNLSGAVPDVDDTSAALLVLHQWAESRSCEQNDRPRIEVAARLAVRWLLGLQNRDGGWPTFCRGWGKLPFDRSGADLTAHAMRALHVWRHVSSGPVERAIRRGWRYLERQQRPDGSWVPLWFGNQDHPAEENPVFGTARVLLAYCDLGLSETTAASRGFRWLESMQQADGGWHGGCSSSSGVRATRPSSVEETGLAMEALLARGCPGTQDGGPAGSGATLQEPLVQGLQWLTQAVLSQRHRENAPIGFYFAKLWYYEKLYPLVFAVGALGRAARRVGLEIGRKPAPDQ